MRFTINGKRYELELDADLPPGTRGLCDAPTRSHKKIKVSARVKPDEMLEVVLHECLHAALWSISEEDVDHTARDLAKVIKRLVKEGVLDV